MSRVRVPLALTVAWLLTLLAGLALGSREILAIAALWLTPIPVVLSRREGRPFDALDPIWLVTALFVFTYCVVPAAQLWDSEPFVSVTGALQLSGPHYYLAMFLSGLGLLALYAGYFLPLGGRLARNCSRWVPRATDGQVLVTAVALVGIGLVAIEMALVLVQAWNYSPRDVVTGGLRAGTVEAINGRGYLTIGFLALGVGIACSGLAFVRWAGDDARRRRWVLPFFALLAVIALAIFGGLLGSRNLAVVTVVQLIGVLHFAFRRIGPRLGAAAFGALALFSIVFISLRNTGSFTLNPVVWAGYVGKTFDGFNFLTGALARVHDFAWGRTLGEDAALTYLPRAFFPSKPDVYGILAAQEMIIPGINSTVGGGATFPPGILAEGYLNFGVPGLLAIPFAVGLLVRVLYDWAAKTGAAIAILVFSYLLGDQTALFRGFGPVLPGLAVVIVLLVPLLLGPRLAALVGSRRTRLGVLAGLAVVALAVVAVVSPAIPVTEPGKSNRRGGPSKDDLAPPLAFTPPFSPANGRVTLLVFWASWCDGCADQLREASAVAASDRGVRVLGVAYQDSAEGVAKTMRSIDGHWENRIDQTGRTTLAEYHVGQFPTVFVVNTKGTISCLFEGKIGAQVLAATASASRTPSYRCT